MKLMCETQIMYRHLSNTRMNKSVKSTLAFGIHPKTENGKLFIMLFTPQNKTGIKYMVENNIHKMFTRFVSDGKATISFINPEHDILIKSDAIQLKSFLSTLKVALENKSDRNKIGLSSLATTAIPKKSFPVKKLKILKVADYPIKGFPKMVQELTISGINRTIISPQIPLLRCLTVLNLSENKIKIIPEALGELKLRELNLSCNLIDETFGNWKWLSNKTIKSTLRLLDISNNNIKSFPYHIVRLENLVTLNIDHNSIPKVPFAIRRLTTLRYFNVGSNDLQSLPNTINHLRLDTLNVCENRFQFEKFIILDRYKENVSSILELSARVVEAKKIPFGPGKIPQTLVDAMLENPLCFCGAVCFSPRAIGRVRVENYDRVKNLIFNTEQVMYQDFVMCTKCEHKFTL